MIYVILVVAAIATRAYSKGFKKPDETQAYKQKSGRSLAKNSLNSKLRYVTADMFQPLV